MQQPIIQTQPGTGAATITTYAESLRSEFLRKSLHLLIALVPSLAYLFGPDTTLVLLSAGTLFYTTAEWLRLGGVEVVLVSRVTILASRSHGSGGFELGPVTLGLGAMLSLFLFPAPAAAIAIYALAFGDGLASLGGKVFGTMPIPQLGGKTLEGSTICYVSIFVVTYSVTRDPGTSVVVAAGATAIEAMPLRDFDNIALPLGSGLIATALLAA